MLGPKKVMDEGQLGDPVVPTSAGGLTTALQLPVAVVSLRCKDPS